MVDLQIIKQPVPATWLHVGRPHRLKRQRAAALFNTGGEQSKSAERLSASGTDAEAAFGFYIKCSELRSVAWHDFVILSCLWPRDKWISMDIMNIHCELRSDKTLHSKIAAAT